MPRAKKTASTTTPPTKANDSTRRKRPADPAPSFTHDVIAQRAYELFMQDGAQSGRDIEHWLRAEQELRAGGAS